MEKHWKLLNYKNNQKRAGGQSWVVYEGGLLRFPYYSEHSKGLGSGREICPLTFGEVLEFGEGVFVFKENDNVITIFVNSRACAANHYVIPESVR